jgi:hypothetical protein
MSALSWSLGEWETKLATSLAGNAWLSVFLSAKHLKGTQCLLHLIVTNSKMLLVWASKIQGTSPQMSLPLFTFTLAGTQGSPAG